MSRLILLLVLAAGPLAAQESEAEGDTLHFYGTVAAITQTQLIVFEYDWDQEKTIEVVYRIDPQVRLDNIPSLGDIRKGVMVIFTYIRESGNSVIIDMLVSRQDEDEQGPAETL